MTQNDLEKTSGADGSSENDHAPLRVGERLSRCERVLRSRTFRHIQRRGHRRVGALVVVITRRGEQSWTRLGLTVSRKVGGAVTRNRVKRRLREIFRRNKASFPAGHDVVIIARKDAATASFQALQAEVLSLCQRPPRRSRSRGRQGDGGRSG